MRHLRGNVKKTVGVQIWGSEEIPVGRHINMRVLYFSQAHGYSIPGAEEWLQWNLD